MGKDTIMNDLLVSKFYWYHFLLNLFEEEKLGEKNGGKLFYSVCKHMPINVIFSRVLIITGYEAGDCIGGFERGHMGNRQVVYAWVESHFGLNFVALAGGSSDMASHIKEFPL